MKEKLKFMLPGIIITVILLVSEITFVSLLWSTSLIAVKFLIIGLLGLLALSAAVWLLTEDYRHKVRMIIGCILALIIFITQCFGGYYVLHGAATLDKITETETEFAEIGIYVLKDDPATSAQDIADYNIGILAVLDRDNTDNALKHLAELLGKEPKTTQYDSISDLLDALFSGEIKAIMLNTAYLDLFEDIEGHEDDAELIRAVHTFEIEATTDKPNSSDVIKNDSVFTLYITGIDTRSRKISKRSRSDVNILVTANTETGQIVLVSTPRDYYVPLSISKGIEDKLTHSGVYGTQVSIDTMEMLYDIDIDYYFKVNFTGFKEIIDALGGITVYSNMSFKSNGFDIVKGENHLNGEAALSFARNRKSVGGDRQRGIHQMEVVRAVINKAMSPVLLTNYTEILNGISESFETSMPYSEVAKLVRNQLDKGTKWNIVSYAVNGKGATKRVYSLSQKAYVMIPDQNTVNEAKRLMEQVRNGEILPEQK